MTVIAWDGVTLAADRQCNIGGACMSVRKIHRVGEELVGLSGDGPFAQAVLAWLHTDRDVEKYPVMSADSCSNVLVIRPDRTILLYEHYAHPIELRDQKVANGAGRDFALAAMHLGCSARSAVEVACLFSAHCGNGVDTLTFGGEEEKV